VSYDQSLSLHTLKEIPTGPGVKAFFCFKPSTTTDAFNLVVFKGVIYLSSPDHGALTLMPFAPDALIWLQRNVHSEEALLEALPENLTFGLTDRLDISVEMYRHDSVEFFLAALRRFQALVRRAA
jgi:hypothetical protein